MVSQRSGAGQESPVVLSKPSHTALLGEGKLSLSVLIYISLCVSLRGKNTVGELPQTSL